MTWSQRSLIEVLDRIIGSEAGISAFQFIRVNPKSRKLNIRDGRWQRFHGPWPSHNSYFDKEANDYKSEDWTLSLRIRYVNAQRSCVTTENDPVSALYSNAPAGLHVYRPSSDIMPCDISERICKLYEKKNDDIIRDGDSNIIFYSHSLGNQSPNFSATFSILENLDSELSTMVMTYAKSIQSVLGASDEDLNTSAMSIVKYEPGKGIRQHIDNITDPMGTIGPLVSVALGSGRKFLDLMPTLSDNQSLCPMRIEVEQGYAIIMDGDSRLEYSHSVPYGHRTEMFSLLFKFRQIRCIPLHRTNSQLNIDIYYTIDPLSGDICECPQRST